MQIRTVREKEVVEVPPVSLLAVIEYVVAGISAEAVPEIIPVLGSSLIPFGRAGVIWKL